VSVTDDSGTTTLFFDPVDASLLATSRAHPRSVDSPATKAWQAYVASSVVNRTDQKVANGQKVANRRFAQRESPKE
jgi:hypothetical protein